MRFLRITLTVLLVVATTALVPACKEGEEYVETVMGARDRAGSAALKTSLRAYDTAIQGYQLNSGRYPERLADLPDVASGRLPSKDTWDQPLTFRLTGSGYELRSVGPDGRPQTEDDVVLRDGVVE